MTSLMLRTGKVVGRSGATKITARLIKQFIEEGVKEILVQDEELIRAATLRVRYY
jgi:hypothetical protein